MRVGIITYAANHLKTEQVAVGLMHHGYSDISFFALPFKQRPARKIIFEHRPDMTIDGHSSQVAQVVGATYHEVESAHEIAPYAADNLLIAGADLLPPEFVNATLGRVLNSHPGKISLVRGLDASKWANLEQQPVKNNLHIIDADTDAVEVVALCRTPLFPSDSLEKFAARHPEIEIDIMIDFEGYLNDRQVESGEAIEPGVARMRMKAEQQKLLHSAFEDYKKTNALAA